MKCDLTARVGNDEISFPPSFPCVWSVAGSGSTKAESRRSTELREFREGPSEYSVAHNCNRKI